MATDTGSNELTFRPSTEELAMLTKTPRATTDERSPATGRSGPGRPVLAPYFFG